MTLLGFFINCVSISTPENNKMRMIKYSIGKAFNIEKYKQKDSEYDHLFNQENFASLCETEKMEFIEYLKQKLGANGILYNKSRFHKEICNIYRLHRNIINVFFQQLIIQSAVKGISADKDLSKYVVQMNNLFLQQFPINIFHLKNYRNTYKIQKLYESNYSNLFAINILNFEEKCFLMIDNQLSRRDKISSFLNLNTYPNISIYERTDESLVSYQEFLNLIDLIEILFEDFEKLLIREVTKINSKSFYQIPKLLVFVKIVQEIKQKIKTCSNIDTNNKNKFEAFLKQINNILLNCKEIENHKKILNIIKISSKIVKQENNVIINSIHTMN